MIIDGSTKREQCRGKGVEMAPKTFGKYEIYNRV